jgi:hypothetical protein
MEVREVDLSTLNEVINLMKKQNLNSLSVDELLVHIGTLKIEPTHQEKSDLFSSTSPESIGGANRPSPAFTFQSPDRLFSPADLVDRLATKLTLEETNIKPDHAGVK